MHTHGLSIKTKQNLLSLLKDAVMSFLLKKESKLYFLWKMLLCFLACKRKQNLLFSNPSGMSGKDAKRCYYVFLLKKESKNLSKPEPNLPWVRYFIIPWDRKTRIGASLNLTGYATRDL